jgi:hypothetical protein
MYTPEQPPPEVGDMKPDLTHRLRQLASADAALPPPYDFATFQARRRAARVARPGSAGWMAMAASVAALGVALVSWRLLEVPGEAPAVLTTAEFSSDGAAEGPALVRVGSAAARADLEERIALIDALLSEAQVSGGAAEDIRAMQAGRTLLVDSLQQVAWAETLIEY